MTSTIMGSLALALLARGASGAAVPHVITELPARVVVDWTAGTLAATGAGAPDLRAPGPQVARIGAARRARLDAARKLDAAARGLPMGTSTVGKRAEHDPRAEAGLREVLGQAVEEDIRYASDGAVEVTFGVQLEAIQDLFEARSMATGSPHSGAPTAVVVDGRKAGLKPCLGLTLVAASASYTVPVVFYRDPKAAVFDVRAGNRVKRATAVKLDGASVSVDLSPRDLDAARNAGARVIVIVP